MIPSEPVGTLYWEASRSPPPDIRVRPFSTSQDRFLSVLLGWVFLIFRKFSSLLPSVHGGVAAGFIGGPSLVPYLIFIFHVFSRFGIFGCPRRR